VGFKIDQMIQNRPYRFILVINYRPPDQDLTAWEREGDGLTGLGSSDEFPVGAALQVDDGDVAGIPGGDEEVDEVRMG
jgi:hypothetical protein